MTFQNIRSMLTIEMKGILTSGCTLKVLRHGNRFAARVRRRYFSEGEKRRPEIPLLFVGYAIVCSRFSHSGEDAKVKGTRKVGGVCSRFLNHCGPDYLGAWNRLGVPGH